jgi:hypothetical protein
MQRKEKTLEAIRPHLNTGEELVRLMEKLFFIIKVSVEETNPEQRYLIEKLAQMNIVAEKMLDNLKELVEVSTGLSEYIPDAVSKEYSKVVLRKITEKIESMNKENNSFEATLARLLEQDP